MAIQPETLRGLREQAGVSIDTFAARLGVSPEDLAAMETGTLEIPERFEPEAFNVASDIIEEQGIS